MILLQGRDWDIVSHADCWRVERCDSSSVGVTLMHAFIEAQQLGYALDGGGYLLDAVGHRQPADSVYFPVRVEPRLPASNSAAAEQRREPMTAA